MSDTTPTRLRVVQYLIQPMVFADDGTDLTPVQLQPVTVKPGDLVTFPEEFAAQLAEEEARINAEGQVPASLTDQ